jgi:hypothetical protein
MIYKKFEDIEKLVENGLDLSMIPIQPLYVSLQTSSKDQVALILPKLSSEQRQALRDIDLWQKDIIDPQSGLYWLEVYSKCPDDSVVLEYVKSEDFLLTIKNQFTVQTFDVEDPLYPDDDNYFLTEDNLLLISFGEDFTFVQELKELIRRLYSDLGVENAYSFLFKMVVDSYQTMEENNYQEKKERLRDFGFVDYYEALECQAPFHSIEQIKNFIAQKKSVTGHLESQSLNQSLHANSLVPYQSGMNHIKEALDKIDNDARAKFLHFNFIRLVNAKMTLEDALKNGTLAMTKAGLETKQGLELGYEFVQNYASNSKNVFLNFDFMDLHRIGLSLIQLNRKKIKKALSQTPFEKDDLSYFLGMYWNAFLENSFDEVAKFKFDGSSKAREINDLATYSLWTSASESFVSAQPFVVSFFGVLAKLKASGVINDQFYLNYEVDNIDFESVMISSLINFSCGHFEEATNGKMGVTIIELKNFYHNYFTKKNDEYLIKGEEDLVLKTLINDFSVKFGFKSIPGFDKYIYQIMVEQLNGYEIDSMDEEEFKHIGGPILLQYTKN